MARHNTIVGLWAVKQQSERLVADIPHQLFEHSNGSSDFTLNK